MQHSDLVLNFYVRNVEHDGDGSKIFFTVVQTQTPSLTVTVTRYNDTKAWYCSCDGRHCRHIQRAILYYNNMLARSKDLKDQLKIRKEMRDQPTTKKRMIRLEGE